MFHEAASWCAGFYSNSYALLSFSINYDLRLEKKPKLTSAYAANMLSKCH